MIGAGLAGLSAGVLLQQAGWRVRVLESKGHPGGRVAPMGLGRDAVDAGAQYLSASYSRTLRLVRSVGLGGQLIELPKRAAFLHPGGLSAARILSLLEPSASSVANFLRLARRLAHIRWRMGTSRGTLLQQWKAFAASGSFGGDASLHRGRFRDLLMAIGRAFYFDDRLNLIQVRDIDFPMAYFLGRGVYSLQDGLCLLTKRLAERLDVEYSVKVLGLQRMDTGVVIETDRGRLQSPYVVLTVPSSGARGILEKKDAFEQDLLAASYCPTVLISVLVDGCLQQLDNFGGYFGVAVSDRVSRLIAAVSYCSSVRGCKLSAAKAGESGVLKIFLSGSLAEEARVLDDATLGARVIQELNRIIPGVDRLVADFGVARWPAAISEFSPGRIRAMLRYRRSRTQAARILLAGDYSSLPCIEGAVESGHWAASQFLRSVLP